MNSNLKPMDWDLDCVSSPANGEEASWFSSICHDSTYSLDKSRPWGSLKANQDQRQVSILGILRANLPTAAWKNLLRFLLMEAHILRTFDVVSPHRWSLSCCSSRPWHVGPSEPGGLFESKEMIFHIVPIIMADKNGRWSMLRDIDQTLFWTNAIVWTCSQWQWWSATDLYLFDSLFSLFKERKLFNWSALQKRLNLNRSWSA